jgi:hypothetical protein
MLSNHGSTCHLSICVQIIRVYGSINDTWSCVSQAVIHTLVLAVCGAHGQQAGLILSVSLLPAGAWSSTPRVALTSKLEEFCIPTYLQEHCIIRSELISYHNRAWFCSRYQFSLHQKSYSKLSRILKVQLEVKTNYAVMLHFKSFFNAMAGALPFN